MKTTTASAFRDRQAALLGKKRVEARRWPQVEDPGPIRFEVTIRKRLVVLDHCVVDFRGRASASIVVTRRSDRSATKYATSFQTSPFQAPPIGTSDARSALRGLQSSTIT